MEQATILVVQDAAALVDPVGCAFESQVAFYFRRAGTGRNECSQCGNGEQLCNSKWYFHEVLPEWKSRFEVGLI